MLGFVLGLLVAFLFLLHKYTTKLSRHGRGELLPGPPGIPFLGNLHQLDNSASHLQLWQLSKKYGPFMFLRLGLVPTIVVSSAEMAKEILRSHDAMFPDRPFLLGQQRLSYNGLDLAFSRYDTYNKEIRKVCLVHLFHAKRVQSFRYIREEEVLRMVQKIAKSCPKVINLSEAVMALAITVLSRVAFGKSYEDEESERSRFHGLLHESQAILGSFFVSDYFPPLGWVDRLTGLISRMEKNFKEFDVFYQEIIDEHLDPNRPKPGQPDIVDILLLLKNDQPSWIDLTLDHIKAVLMNIFVGGTDASAAALVWVMTMVIKNSRVMNKVQQEIRSFVGNDEMGFVNEDDLQKLPYLKAVVKETMRLQPPIPVYPREATQECTINGYVIEPKTVAYVNAWAIGRDPEAWDNPEEFWPERFMGSCVDFKGQDFELIPFGSGRRGCPGTLMGAVTVELAVANLLYSFDWELPEGMKQEDINTDVVPGITMHKKDPLCLVARKANKIKY